MGASTRKGRPDRPVGEPPSRGPARIRLLGTGVDLDLRMGNGPAKPTAGSAEWDEVSRPELEALTDYTGDSLLRLDVPVLLDGHSEDRDIQPELDAILALCHGSDGQRPQDFVATGPIIYSGIRCVMEAPEFLDDPPSIRTAGGVLTRQALTLKLIEFNDPDTISFVESPAGPAKGGKKKKKRKKTVTTKAGQTLLQIAQKVLGDRSRAKEIGKLNGIRDPRKKLPAGRVLRLPPLKPPKAS